MRGSQDRNSEGGVRGSQDRGNSEGGVRGSQGSLSNPF